MNYFKHDQALVHPKAQIGQDSRVWAFVNILEGAVIGHHCNIGDGCFIEGGAVVGNYVTVKNGVEIFNGITIEDDVFVGAHTSFINDRYPRSHRLDAWTLQKTFVKRGATIGANATILCGVTIGEYAVVGAGAVVTKNIAPYIIVIGNPARPIGYACRCGRKLNDDLQCSCGLNYRIDQNHLIPKS
ncbi:MAG: N-acetyltransferase [Candidatus Omnitrophica bacterium]|nr:N-acetyltransferase [Candidatus Omnitrophota bacterium]